DLSIATCDNKGCYRCPYVLCIHDLSQQKRLQMPCLITLGLVETLFDPVVDRVKMKLAGSITIKRDRVVNELFICYGIDVGVGAGAGVGAGQDQGTTFCRRCCALSRRSARNKLKILSCIFKH
ncbi:hypothetical protein EJD97_021092, partial [Solanum chilense]